MPENIPPPTEQLVVSSCDRNSGGIEIAKPAQSGNTGSCNDVTARKRQTQKRHRERTKERSVLEQTLLQDMQQRLQDVETQRAGLEARNKVLEEYAFAQPGPSSDSAAGPSNAALAAAPEKVNTWSTLPHAPDVVKALLLPSVKLTSAEEGPEYMTPFDISQLPVVKYAKLYTGAISQLRELLKNASTSNNREQLVTSTIEATSLILADVMCKPSSLKERLQTSMADGSTVDEEGPQDPAAILDLLALSDLQVRDLLALRRLFFGELGRLMAERTDLMQKMASHSGHLAKVAAWADRLQQNITEEHQRYLKFVTAVYLGINTAWQMAVGMVASYPSFLDYTVIEVLASTKGEPPVDALIGQTGGSTDEWTWNQVEQYVRRIHVANMFTYVPFLPAVQQKMLCTQSRSDSARQPYA